MRGALGLTLQQVRVLVLPMQHEPLSEAELEEPVSVEETGGEDVVADEASTANGESGRAEGEPAVEVMKKAEPTPEEELAKWKELAMRATADLDNFRKRMAREKSDALRYGNQALLEELLPVLDNFEMGLQAAAGDQESMIFRGMAMVKKQMDDFLSGQGVEEIPASGEVFDPNLHDAVSQEESAEMDEGMVLRVIRRGFKMRDRLLRPANVIVTKAPGDVAPAEEEGDEQ